MIAKLVVCGEDRASGAAPARARRLREYEVVGVTTNVAFLAARGRARAFASGTSTPGSSPAISRVYLPPPRPRPTPQCSRSPRSAKSAVIARRGSRRSDSLDRSAFAMARRRSMVAQQRPSMRIDADLRREARLRGRVSRLRGDRRVVDMTLRRRATSARAHARIERRPRDAGSMAMRLARDRRCARTTSATCSADGSCIAARCVDPLAHAGEERAATADT